MVQVAGKQSLGKRDNQEDSFKLFFQDEQDQGSDVLMVLTDGMGGHVGGEVASRFVCNVFGRHFVEHATANRPRPRLEQSLHAANTALGEKIAQTPELKGMGCTLIGALKIDDRLSWVSVGDSVMYLLRDGHLKRLNADHSLYSELLQMVSDGKITQEEADRHPRRNTLRSAVNGKPIKLLDLEAVDLKSGDLVLLASDGLEALSDTEIAELLATEKRPDVRSVCSDLLNAIEAKGLTNQDNTTVIAYRHSAGGRTSSGSMTRWGSLLEAEMSEKASKRYNAATVAVAATLVAACVAGGAVYVRFGSDTMGAEPISGRPTTAGLANQGPTDGEVIDPETETKAAVARVPLATGDTPPKEEDANQTLNLDDAQTEVLQKELEAETHDEIKQPIQPRLRHSEDIIVDPILEPSRLGTDRLNIYEDTGSETTSISNGDSAPVLDP